MKPWLEKIFKNNDGASKKGVSIRYVGVVLAIGIGLMLIGSFFPNGDSKKHQAVVTAKQNEPDQSTFGQSNRSGPSSVIEYEHYYANELKDALENVYGVSGVIVEVHITTSKTKIVGENNSVDSQTTTEQDKQGGTRKITQHNEKHEPVIINGNGKDQPLIIGTKQPEISGVVVVTGGGDNPQVKLWVKQAVHSLLGVPEYRIAVLPKKQRGNEN
ncbi:MAG TPA: stage III sporulation protein AG [Bacillales bacterium]|nr:stage III sporulation protein AG [Bacillales bacterium]